MHEGKQVHGPAVEREGLVFDFARSLESLGFDLPAFFVVNIFHPAPVLERVGKEKRGEAVPGKIGVGRVVRPQEQLEERRGLDQGVGMIGRLMFPFGFFPRDGRTGHFGVQCTQLVADIIVDRPQRFFGNVPGSGGGY